jgi:hypothetical protein
MRYRVRREDSEALEGEIESESGITNTEDLNHLRMEARVIRFRYWVQLAVMVRPTPIIVGA